MSETYAELLEECAEIRTEIDEVHSARYGQLRSGFEAMTGLKGSIFKKANDLIYYTGGYPSESSPPKSEVFADEIAGVLRVLKALGSDFMVNLLQRRGVKVEVSDLTYPSDRDEFVKHLGTEVWPEGSREVDALKRMSAEAQELQKTICVMADEIKLDLAERVKDDFQIEKPAFLKAVKLSSMVQRQGKSDKARERVDGAIHSAESVVEALEPIVKQLGDAK